MKTKKHDPVNIVFKISELVRQLTDEDFKEFEDTIKQQEEYYHPLKPATTQKQRDLAKHNKEMVECLKELKKLVSKKS